MNNAIAVLRAEGAIVEDFHEFPRRRPRGVVVEGVAGKTKTPPERGAIEPGAPASVLPLHLYDRAHPGMDAALEVVIAFSESGHLRLAARSDVRRHQALRSGH